MFAFAPHELKYYKTNVEFPASRTFNATLNYFLIRISNKIANVKFWKYVTHASITELFISGNTFSICLTRQLCAHNVFLWKYKFKLNFQIIEMSLWLLLDQSQRWFFFQLKTINEAFDNWNKCDHWHLHLCILSH